MRLLVIGAGATGGYFGGRLAQGGRDVTFLVRPRRAAQLQETGLQIVSPHGDVTVRPKLVTAKDLVGHYDAVLLALRPIRSPRQSTISAPPLGRGRRSCRC